MFKGNRKLLEDVLDGLFHIAKADEEVRPQEEQFLGEVTKLFGFTVSEFNSIKSRHLVAAKRNPYDVLGVKPSISDEDLKSYYRMLLADSHSEELSHVACRRSLPSSPSRSAPRSAKPMKRS